MSRYSKSDRYATRDSDEGSYHNFSRDPNIRSGDPYASLHEPFPTTSTFSIPIRGNTGHRNAPTTSRQETNSTSKQAKPLPEGVKNSLLDVQGFVNKIMGTRCVKCNNKIVVDFEIGKFVRKWRDDSLVKDEKFHHAKGGDSAGDKKKVSISVVECRKCQALTCVGCGKKPQLGRNSQMVIDHHLDWCCDRGRVFALWIILSVYDDLELMAQQDSAEALNRNAHSNHMKPKSRGVGYDDVLGYDWIFNMYAYGPLSRGLTHPVQWNGRAENDGEVEELLRFLTRLLPSSSNFPDIRPVRGLLQLSLILDKIANLLRNDSIEDVESRHHLYYAALSFVDKAMKNSKLVTLVVDRRYAKRQTCGLSVLSRSNSNGERDNKHGTESQLLQVDDEKIASLASSFENLAKQGEIIMKSMKRTQYQPQDADSLIKLCKSICKVHDAAAAGKVHDSKPPSITKQECWATYHKENCLAHDTRVLDAMCLKYQRMASQISDPPLGRMKRLVNEIAVLSTSLPLGVFVKTEESRLDVIKCLVIGPVDTPFEGGLFEFDIFCPKNYPYSPPQVWFSGPGKGKVNYNPNIHPDGKVCLSLINTWPGPPSSKWQPGISTLLQVLVSMQSMIFNDDPWRNEPGRGELSSRRAEFYATKYAQKIQPRTIRFAVLHWLYDPARREGLWKEVLEKYFWANAEVLVGVARRWARENPLIRAWDGGMGYGEVHRGGNGDLVEGLERAVRGFL
ncbi:MAG: hypothetical protein M1834_009045 [Cirrosporium novae-zelandiae]|nr:MAG: hypothetical protein M1834_009045 [Cirrosporium novae-zelandiae]